MKTKGKYALAAGGVVGAALLLAMSARQPATTHKDAIPFATPVAELKDAAVYSTTASALYESYRDNQAATNRLLVGRTLLIMGKVVSIDSAFSDALVVRLDTGHAALPAEMEMLPAEKGALDGVSVGQEVIAQCRGAFYYLYAITGVSCVLRR
ncbi:hypothetical protein J1780_03585 [Rahnella aceris]|uniref:hypothetical protein n=1 Tax=Rahnella sp. (strain Y9602) TaxID=2703885 RepID=UPI001C2745D8|nr:hypothetical protein [Rahnella aceris]MBU9839037.1 hypothetical protein [Rahnella aceris]